MVGVIGRASMPVPRLLGEADREFQLGGRTAHADRHDAARRPGRDHPIDVRTRRHRRAVEGEDDVAGPEAGRRRGAFRIHVGEQHARPLPDAQGLGQLRGERLGGDTQPGAAHASLLQQRQIDRAHR
jgi:hypothetical protein